MGRVNGELNLYPKIDAFFSHYEYVYEEVPFGRKRIDLVYQSRNGYITSVEVKLEKWREALSQALVNQLISTYSYVAIPNTKIHVVNQSLFLQHGIGLLSIGDTVKVLVSAKRGGNMDNRLAQQIRTTLGNWKDE